MRSGCGVETMGAAQREVLPGVEEAETAIEEFSLTEPSTGSRAELKRQVAERLASHRRRRGLSDGAAGEAGGHLPARKGKQNAIAAAVAERYAQTPSYRAFLAEQAKHAAEEAAARAEVARRNAVAAAEVQQQLLMELERWEAPQQFTAETAVTVQAPAPPPALPSAERAPQPRYESQVSVGGLTVRLYEDLGPPGPRHDLHRREQTPGQLDPAEAHALDAEIDFRKSPVFEDYKAFLARDAEPPIPLPANLLEFPRQLVAARKARPRLAEGPLRDEAPRTQQLRIFEVEAGQISTAPVVEQPAEWATIRLDAHIAAPAAPVTAPHMAVMAALAPPETAPMRLRIMAALVDLGLVLAAGVAFVAVFARLAGEVPSGMPALVALGVTLFAFALLYQLVFFTFSDQTPGMRYARIGLCTFSDDNPTRAAMRRRILAQLVALVPAGLGFLWSLLDDDGLGWHDRISRMYQRAY